MKNSMERKHAGNTGVKKNLEDIGMGQKTGIGEYAVAVVIGTLNVPIT